jgi:hypothetical protein
MMSVAVAPQEAHVERRKPAEIPSVDGHGAKAGHAIVSTAAAHNI